MDTAKAVEKVKKLFEDHPQLIIGFNRLLPEKYKIVVSGATCTAPPANPKEFAAAYVMKIRSRFSEKPETFKQFLQILKSYQSKQKSLVEVVDKIDSLFANHADLLMEFPYFLPDEVQAAAKAQLENAARERETGKEILQAQAFLQILAMQQGQRGSTGKKRTSNEMASNDDGSVEIKHSKTPCDMPTLIATLEGHEHPVQVLLVSDSDNRLYSGSSDDTIKMWDTFANTCVETLEGHCGGVLSLSLSNQHHRLYSGSEDKTIKVWDTQSLECVHTFEGHSHWVTSLVVDEITNTLYSGSYDGTIKVWKLDALTCLHTLQRKEESGVWCLTLDHTSKRLYAGTEGSTIEVWDTVSHTCVCTLEGHSSDIHNICLSEDGSRLYSACDDKTVKVWDTATYACIATLEGHTDKVTSLCLCDKTQRLISASNSLFDRSIRVWDIVSYACLHEVQDEDSSGETYSLAMYDDRSKFYAGGDRDILVWQL